MESRRDAIKLALAGTVLASGANSARLQRPRLRSRLRSRPRPGPASPPFRSGNAASKVSVRLIAVMASSSTPCSQATIPTRRSSRTATTTT